MNGNANGLNTNSYISIGLMITIIGSVVWLNNSLSVMTYRITKIEERQARPDPWTGNDQFRWSVELKKLNPKMEVPEPRHKSD